MEWRWVEGGIEFDGKIHAFVDLPAAKAKSVVEGMDSLLEILSVLRDARAAFREGRAKYEGAGKNLGDLLGEISRYEHLWETGYTGLSSLFVPALPVEKVEDGGRAQFAYSILLKLADRVNKRA